MELLLAISVTILFTLARGGELTILQKGTSLACISRGESAPLTWVFPLDNTTKVTQSSKWVSQSQYYEKLKCSAPLLYDQDCPLKGDRGDWHVASTWGVDYGPVLDKRWNVLPMYCTDGRDVVVIQKVPDRERVTIYLSVLAQDNMYILLTDRAGSYGHENYFRILIDGHVKNKTSARRELQWCTKQRVCTHLKSQIGTILDNGTRWALLKITFQQNTKGSIITMENDKSNETDDWSVRNKLSSFTHVIVRTGNGVPGYIKFHKYNVLKPVKIERSLQTEFNTDATTRSLTISITYLSNIPNYAIGLYKLNINNNIFEEAGLTHLQAGSRWQETTLKFNVTPLWKYGLQFASYNFYSSKFVIADLRVIAPNEILVSFLNGANHASCTRAPISTSTGKINETIKSTCGEGLFGSDCSLRCYEIFREPKDCYGARVCDPTKCVCLPGFSGPQCQPITICSAGQYGDDCKSRCSENCVTSNSCDPKTGSCAGGCKPGLSPPLCTSTCVDGKYGESCKSSCSGNCLNNDVCDKVTGHCPSGCRDGWGGDLCDGDSSSRGGCIAGRYSSDCSGQCSQHCKDNDVCDAKTGYCPNGCEPGYISPMCTQGDTTPVSAILVPILLIILMALGYLAWRQQRCTIAKARHVLTTSRRSSDPGEQSHNPAAISLPVLLHVPDETAGPSSANLTLQLPPNNIPKSQARTAKPRAQSPSTPTAPLRPSSYRDRANDVPNMVPPVPLRPTSYRDRANDVPNMVPPVPVRQSPDRNRSDAVPNMVPPVPLRKSPHTDNPSAVPKMYPSPPFHSYLVSITQLREFVETAVGSDLLKSQHALFPRGQTSSWDEGRKPEHKGKNRYGNLVAYDDTRVCLTPLPNLPHSHYINANYIDGYQQPRAYIATQGPKENTLGDFWRMVWQENVSTIVMLANLFENGTNKCEQYWPEMGQSVKVMGGVRVTAVSETTLLHYIVRKLRVSKDNQTREVHQLHYTAWPDHGVPTYPYTVAVFIRHTISTMRENSPLLLHCSAGVGRTGTVILAHTGMLMAKAEDAVDFLALISTMRSQRPNMVDNYTQYELAHKIVLELLFVDDTSVPAENFATRLKTLKKHRGFDNEFSGVQEACQYDVEYSETLTWPQDKNRFQHIVPVCSGRVMLSGTASEYINAVYVDGVSSRARYIVTQVPLPNTLADFWLMVWQRSSVVVLLSTPDPAQDPSTCAMFGNDHYDMSVSDKMRVKVVSDSDRKIFQIRKVQISFDQTVRKVANTETRDVTVISMPGWETGNTACPRDLVQVLDEVERQRKDETPVIVACHDGARASGVYVAASHAIEGLKLTDRVDIGGAVRAVRHNRPNFIKSKEQYEYVYDVVQVYCDSFDTYANV